MMQTDGGGKKKNVTTAKNPAYWKLPVTPVLMVVNLFFSNRLNSGLNSTIVIVGKTKKRNCGKNTKKPYLILLSNSSSWTPWHAFFSFCTALT